MFGYNNDRLFPDKYTMKDHISNTKLEKGKRKIQTKCAHAPWASYNTP